VVVYFSAFGMLARPHKDCEESGTYWRKVFNLKHISLSPNYYRYNYSHCLFYLGMFQIEHLSPIRPALFRDVLEKGVQSETYLGRIDNGSNCNGSNLVRVILIPLSSQSLCGLASMPKALK
jgi:hypothetical protein